MVSSCSFLHSKVAQVSGGGGGWGWKRGCLCTCASVCLVCVCVCVCLCVCTWSLWCVCAQRFYRCWIPSVKKKKKKVCWALQNCAYLWANVYYSISISTDTACLKTASWLCKKKGVEGTLLLFSFTSSAISTAMMMMMMKCCLMSSGVSWHIRDKLRPMPRHGSI